MELIEIIKLSIKSVLTIAANPLFWIVMLLIYVQYRRVAKMEVRFLGEEKATAKERMFTSLGAGIVGGILGTIVVSFLGVTVELKDFQFILPMAILLMLINIRYLCFSYAGGIISLSSLIFGFPQVNVPSIIALVAILHLIESILIWIDGHRNPTPIFIEHDRYGTVGGFTLQRFWPIPFAVLLVVLSSGSTDINMPKWWPLFISPNLDIDNIILELTVVIAALGYGDIAITSSPKEKSKKSSLRLAVYSIVLLILSAIATRIDSFKFIAALFAPIAHEASIIYSQREEKRKKPIYRNYPRGITILDVNKDSVAEKMGIKSGYILLKANDYYINEKDDLLYVLRQIPSYLRLEVIDKKGSNVILEYRDLLNGINSIGAVIVPKSSNFVVALNENVSILGGVLKRIFRRKRR